nr:hypothetical protein [Streptomyces sp. 846.5]
MARHGGPHRRMLLLCAALAVCGLLTIWYARSLPDFRANLLLNLAPEFLGAIVTVLIIQPFLTRIEEERVREHIRLDYPAFCEQVASATDVVFVLDTFSYLFSGRTADRFVRAVTAAVGRGAVVRILLLDPDSLAARQRSAEIREDVRREIMRNLRDLHRLQAGLPAERREQFQVRLYGAAPSIQLYRWGERMMVSFYPVDRLSGEGQQLEVRISTPLGSFVAERFADLWANARPMAEVMTQRLVLLHEEGGSSALQLEYIRRQDGHVYISDQRVVVELARRRPRPPRAQIDGRDDEVYELELVDDTDETLLASLGADFEEKYGTPVEVFVRLRPLGL